MNPFVVPEKIYISTKARDMRAGINTLVAYVEAALQKEPCDGSLYVFLSRDHKRLKMLRYDGGTWCMWTLMPTEGMFRFRHESDEIPSVEVDRASLVMLLSGVDPSTAIYAR